MYGWIFEYAVNHYFTVSKKMRRGDVGSGRFELPTSSMSTMRSNQLSYEPKQIEKIVSNRTETQPEYKTSFSSV